MAQQPELVSETLGHIAFTWISDLSG